jgi:crossover junction endodeoxyribonuclease RuvC
MLISLIVLLKNIVQGITIKSMKVLGIDPGTITMGYGVIESRDNETSLINYGALNPRKRSPIGERLAFLYQNLIKIISQYQPDEVAIEQPFFAKNAKSAFAIGRAQAVAILAAAVSNVPCYEYTPAEIKQRVANYGASDKGQIQQMVMLQLQMDEIPDPVDAADALAVALCHVQATHLENLLNQ